LALRRLPAGCINQGRFTKVILRRRAGSVRDGPRGWRWIGFVFSAAGASWHDPDFGAKNATLPLMIASLLTEDTLILDNVPRLADVGLLERILAITASTSW